MARTAAVGTGLARTAVGIGAGLRWLGHVKARTEWLHFAVLTQSRSYLGKGAGHCCRCELKLQVQRVEREEIVQRKDHQSFRGSHGERLPRW